MLGPQDIAVIGVLALIFFGPEQLPKVARKAGQVVRDVQNTSQSFIREMEKAADDLDMRDAFKSSETHPGPIVDIPEPAPDPYASVLPSDANGLHVAEPPSEHSPHEPEPADLPEAATTMTGPQPPYGKLAEPSPAIADQMRERPDPDAPLEPLPASPSIEPVKTVRSLPTEVAYEDASGI